MPYLFNEGTVTSPFIVIHFPHTHKFTNFPFALVGVGVVNVQTRRALLLSRANQRTLFLKTQNSGLAMSD